jgi:hypothetical protein
LNIDQLKVRSLGLVVTGGLSLPDAGLYVHSGGVTVNDGGLVLVNGFSVGGGGLLLDGGLKALDTSITVTNGVTVYSNGLRITGGLTIEVNNRQGLVVTDGMSIRSSGLYVTDGFSVLSGGLVIQGGLTVLGDSAIQVIAPPFSDRRLKTDIERVQQSLSKVSRLRGVYFNWVSDEASGLRLQDQRRHVGVIAQEVQQVLPEVVHEMHGGEYLGVNYQELIPLLVEAIRELDERSSRLAVEEEEDEEEEGVLTATALAGIASDGNNNRPFLPANASDDLYMYGDETFKNNVSTGITGYFNSRHQVGGTIGEESCQRDELLKSIDMLTKRLEAAEEENRMLQALLDDEELMNEIDWDSFEL